MVHGHFIAFVSRDLTTQPPKGGLEAVAVSGNYHFLFPEFSGYLFSLCASSTCFCLSVYLTCNDLVTFLIAVSSYSSFPDIGWVLILTNVSKARCVSYYY